MVQTVITWFNPNAEVDESTLVAIDQAFNVVGTLIIAVIAAWAFKRFILRRFEVMAARTDNDVDDRLLFLLRRFYNAIVAFVVLLLVLQILGIEITPLLAGAGLAGFAVAYASKDVLGNFLSGVFLLIDRPLKIGDRIMIERIGSQWGSWGDVVDVGLRTTTVKNTDGVCVTNPNAKLAESVIKNFTPEDGEPVRFRVRFLVDLDND
ncbi:MAG: mechanosensitive ion channel, partial [Proteobacteria bacterium]|nr:mechanosensitive ion channel [Pseudomonadota bacterium]